MVHLGIVKNSEFALQEKMQSEYTEKDIKKMKTFLSIFAIKTGQENQLQN